MRNRGIKTKVIRCIGYFVKAGYEVTVYPTQCYHDASGKGRILYPKAACGCVQRRDLTLMRLWTAMARRKDPVLIGYISNGTTNDFAVNSLHISEGITLEAAEIRRRQTGFLPCDVWSVQWRLFCIYSRIWSVFYRCFCETKQSVKKCFVISPMCWREQNVCLIFRLIILRLHMIWRDNREYQFVLEWWQIHVLSEDSRIVGKEAIFDDGEFESNTESRLEKSNRAEDEIVAADLFWSNRLTHEQMLFHFKKSWERVKFRIDPKRFLWTLDGGVWRRAWLC